MILQHLWSPTNLQLLGLHLTGLPQDAAPPMQHHHAGGHRLGKDSLCPPVFWEPLQPPKPVKASCTISHCVTEDLVPVKSKGQVAGMAFKWDGLKPWWPSWRDVQDRPLGSAQLPGFHRMPEWLRLDGASGGHQVQPLPSCCVYQGPGSQRPKGNPTACR